MTSGSVDSNFLGQRQRHLQRELLLPESRQREHRQVRPQHSPFPENQVGLWCPLKLSSSMIFRSYLEFWLCLKWFCSSPSITKTLYFYQNPYFFQESFNAIHNSCKSQILMILNFRLSGFRETASFEIRAFHFWRHFISRSKKTISSIWPQVRIY